MIKLYFGFFILSFALIGCRSDEVVGPYKIELITVNAVYNELHPEDVAIIDFPIQFKALKMLISDESVVEDVTNQVVWHSSSDSLRYSHSGIFYGQYEGRTTVTATLANTIQSDVTYVLVSSASPVISDGNGGIHINKLHNFMLPGMHEAHTARVQFDNGYEQDLTNFVQWTSSDDSVVSVDKTGDIIANAPGTIAINANYMNLDGGNGRTINVFDLEQLKSTELLLTREKYEIPVRTSSIIKSSLCILDFDDIQQCEDVTDLVALSSSSSAITFDKEIKGRAKARFPSSELVDIAASLELHDYNQSITLQALAKINILNVVIENIEIKATELNISDGILLHNGFDAQFKAIAHYRTDDDMRLPTQNITDDVSWFSTDSDVASFDSHFPGKLESHNLGGIGIYATLDESSSIHIPIQITSALLTSIYIEDMELVYHDSQKLSAIGYFSDGTTQMITEQVSWDIPPSPLFDYTESTHTIQAFELQGSVGTTATIENQDGELLIQSGNIRIKEGIIVCNTVNDTDLNNATGPCLKVIELDDNAEKFSDKLKSGMQLTAAPSENVLKMLHYSENPDEDNVGRTFARIITESGKDGPANGRFGAFTMDGDGSRQAERYCNMLNDINFNYRDNWQLPDNMYILDDLQKVLHYNGMWINFGWPAKRYYWTNSKGISLKPKFYVTDLGKMWQIDINLPFPGLADGWWMPKKDHLYVSCISYAI